MTKAQLHRFTARAPFVCSFLALALVALVLATGWERHAADEGAAAHLFQLTVAIEIVLMAMFVLTATRASIFATVRTVAVQLMVLALPLSVVALAKL
ncbi:MAG: hypothetical protein KGL48_17505 [Sphingomonadales bacterium]|nr:hypothetical protein [Sphingomonadales bacterium]MDE2568683.1 hypothetical protein [Sphingomonadales bacterium]